MKFSEFFKITAKEKASFFTYMIMVLTWRKKSSKMENWLQKREEE